MWTHIIAVIIFSANYICQVKTNDFSSDIAQCDQYACPAGTNGNICSGHGKCNCIQASCICDKDWAGFACQYELSSLTCENLRACVQCQVHKTGSLSEDNDCEVFCKEYPRPFVMKKFYLSRHEVFCSFLDLTNSSDCRFVFKFGFSPHLTIHPLKGHKPDFKQEEYNSNLNHDVYVVAKKNKVCEFDGSTSRKGFPHSGIITDSENTKELITEDVMEYLYNKENASEKRENSYTTLMILFIFIALPFVTCIASCFFNMSKLPCGLCNIFPRPSSTYLRNVRPYPGVIVLSSPSEV